QEASGADRDPRGGGHRLRAVERAVIRRRRRSATASCSTSALVSPPKSHDNSIRIIMRSTRPALLVLLWSATALAKPEVAKAVKLPLPGGEGGIGFDDLMFSP